ncbi:MAG: hypothetical protein RID11_03715 [Roseovarius sp.]|jgi:hypothetical protein|uniref:hypothetical protein n=1 Tax=Roseovarius sp. TaxID=1486281 RepID=UPI0032EC441A
MDSFEGLIRLLLEQDGYWTRQSHKVNLSKEEKVQIGKPSIPRPEIDVIGYKQSSNSIIAMEVKSYLDSPGVPCSSLQETHLIPTGKYKLFTCENYRRIVFSRLKIDLIERGLADQRTEIKLGLAAGRVMKDRQIALEQICSDKGWVVWTPRTIAKKTRALSKLGYENDSYVVTAKLLARNKE